MITKLTLTMEDTVIENAKKYADEKRLSLSKIVEFYFKTLTSRQTVLVDKIPPLTRELSGIAKFRSRKTDKELLLKALLRRNKI